MNSKPYTFDRVVRLLIGVAIFVALYFLVQRLSSVLLPFFIGWFLAYLLHPLVQFFQVKLKFRNRALSIFCTLLIFALGLSGFTLIVIPLISTEIAKMSEIDFFGIGASNLNSIVPLEMQERIKDYMTHLNIESILSDATMMEAVQKVTPQVWQLINGSIDFILGFAIVIVVFMYLIFILLDYETVSGKIFKLIPPTSRPLMSEIFKDMELAMNQYFRGQALVALIVGILFSIGFSIIHLPLAIIMGILIGVFTLVPYLKAILLLPCFALGWLLSLETSQPFWPIFIGVAVVFIAVQIIEDVFLVPNIMGKATGLNPAIILLSLSVWGSLMGVIGMIIALPLTTLFISYYKRFVLKEGSEEIEVADDKEKDLAATSTKKK